jgi:hypothetical protein
MICLVPLKLLASGYSDQENHKIWQLRVAAGKYAAQQAQKKCAWTPRSPRTFSDQLPPNPDVSNEGLFTNIMAMIRIDQNARVISLALRDDKDAHLKVEEVDSENLTALKHIVSTYGFPTLEEVGETGVNAMLMLVAHADEDLEFQKSVALEMDNEVAKGELPSIYPAILKSIRPQITGAPGNRGDVRPDTGEKAHRSPRECFNHEYQDFLDSYIRSGYRQSDQP